MKNAGELARENEALRQRLSRLSEASLRINESLDFETVLQGVLDSARSLTGARYGVITLLDDAGRIQDFLYLRADSGGEPAVRRISQRDALSSSSSAASANRCGCGTSTATPGTGPARVPPADGGELAPALPGGAAPSPGGERRGHLRGREGRSSSPPRTRRPW